jgi:predicted NBD/HSP70 family sugar kinase
MGGFNRAVVLDVIRRSRLGISRVELAAAVGLAPQTVTNVVRRLLEAGLVREAGRQVSGPGKPRTMLELEPRGGFAIGVHLDPSFITYVVVDLESNVVAHSQSRTPLSPEPEAVLESMEGSIRELLGNPDVPAERVLGVGIAAPGPIDRDRGVVAPPLMPGWTEVPLRGALITRLGLPVALEKDVTAAVVAELWTVSDRDRDDFAFLYYGTGIGLGVVTDNQALRGATWNSGDIGHLMVRSDGPLCPCGRIGCLGHATSPSRLVRVAAEAGALRLARRPTAPEVDEAFTELCRLAADGHPVAAPIIRQVATDIATGIVTIANLLDVTEVICGGPFWDRLAGPALADIRAAIDGSPSLVTPHPIRVSGSERGPDVTAVGAACQVLDTVFSPHPSGLLIDRT